MPPAQLPAGGLNIYAPALSDDGRKISLQQDILELENPLHGWGGHLGPAVGIEGDEIDFGPDSREPLCQVQGILVTIIDPPDQDIFKGDPLSFWQGICSTSLEESF